MKNRIQKLLKNKTFQFSVILILSFLLLVGVRKNHLENNLNTYHDDEFHTVYLGIKSFETGTVENFRSLEGARWMYRLFYPGALIKMSQNMGGNTFLSGWEKPGHNYILNEYINKDINPSIVKQRLADDPNLRDFFYFLRLQSIVFVFICLIPLLYYCFKRNYSMSLFFLIVFPAINIQLTHEQSYAYIEPLLMGFISIITWLFLYLYDKRKISSFLMILLGLLSAFIISVKFSALIFVLLLLTMPFVNKEGGYDLETSLKKVFIVFGSFFLSFIIINYYGFFGDINVMLHDFVSNFWNYQNGQSALASNESTAGFNNNFKHVFIVLKDLIGYFIYLLPFVWIFGFYYSNKNEKMKLGILTIVLFISLFGLMKQVEFYERNIVPFYTPFLFISSAFLTIIIREFQNKLVFKNIKILKYLVVSFVLIAYIGVFNAHYDEVLPSTTNNFKAVINNIPDLQKRDMKFVNIDKEVISNYSNNKIDITTDIYFSQVNYKEKLKAIIDKLSYNDIVIVNRDKKNYNQYSNFLLPKYFNTNHQYGNYFVFYNKDLKNNKEDIKQLIDAPIDITDQIIIESIELDKLGENTYQVSLIFNDFLNESLIDSKKRYFYFHAYSYPNDINSLPADRIQYGFVNFDIIDFSITKEFGKPTIKKTFTSNLKQFALFRLGLVDIDNNLSVIKEFVINDVKL
ncbi:hypothetical protein ACFO5O_11215 [Geojedonia litorea]|uniref:Glycosyltransferase RgtA/B/C/D-like domain-containing protein n=1 Tax=Geojedonia litorea TaxID=1268269 RepID=A0ABV9N5Y0_9FLAO